MVNAIFKRFLSTGLGPILFIGISLVFAISGIASEKEQIPKQFSVKRYGDWEVSCSQGSEKNKDSISIECSAYQRLVAQEAEQVVFAVTILPNGKNSFVGIISMPLGGYLAPGIEFSVDTQKPYKILFETCNAKGCHAGFPVGGKVLASLRKGLNATFSVWTNKTKPTKISVSLKGLNDALSALEKVGK